MMRRMRFKILSALGIAAVLTVTVLAGCAGTPTGNGSLRVLVLGENSVPLAGAKVVSNTQPEGQLKVTGITQADGTVTYDDIKAGDYEFYVSRFDYEQKEFKVIVPAKSTTEIAINLVRTPTPTPTP
jgi:hypothetical protein